MKHTLLTLWLTALILFVSQTLWAYDARINKIYYKFSGTNAIVTYGSTYNSYSGVVVIPESVIYNDVTYNVKSIGDDAFHDCTSLTKIVIPNSVTSIGRSAFYGCTGLTSIEIPNSVTSIGVYACHGCTGLTNIVIPNSVTSIGSYAFQDCTGLTNIELPNDGTSIGGYAFYGCSSLQYNEYGNTLYLGNSNNPYIALMSVRDKALVNFIIHENCAIIGNSAFKNCTELASIEIPSSVKSISNSAFSGCTGLTSIEIPNSVTSIYGFAFQGCSSLESISLPFVGDKPHSSSDTYQYPFGYIFGTSSYEGGMETKQQYYGNSTSSTTSSTYHIPRSLKSVKITGSSYIPTGAFYNCAGLTSIELSNSVTTIGDSAFFGCQGTLTINSDLDNFPSSEEGGFCGAKFSEIVIGDNVTKIGKFAFADLVKLKKITLGKSVNRVLSNAFTGCVNLSELYCQPTTPPACVTTVFDEDTYLDCTLYVPEESLGQYKAANVWKNFYDFGVNPDVTPVHKLIYRIDGNIYRTEMVEEGATIVAIEAPVREGYTFVGWSGMPADMIMPDHDLTVVGTYAAPVSETALTIVDGDALDFSLSHTYENLSYTRTFSNTHWQALYVPFSIPVDSLRKYGLQVAELNDTHQWDFNGDGVADSTRVEFFTLTSGSTEANYPYLIRATEPTTLSLTLKDIEVQAAEENSIECSSTKQKFTFVGTYSGVSGADMYANNYYGMSGGGLKRVSNNTVSLKPQRWYMKIENKNGSPVSYYAPSIRFIVDGIEDEAETSDLVLPTVDPDLSAPMYSIEGIRQTSTQLQPGLYLRQGKKIVIR